MKKIVFLLYLLMIISIDANAQRKCGACHGYGKVKIPGTATYGVSNNKRKCTVCQQWYNPSSDHWHACPTCGGQGTLGSASGRINDGSGFLSYLDQADIPVVQNLMQLRMKGTKLAQTTYHHCNGNGICKGCKGTGMIFGSQAYLVAGGMADALLVTDEK